jgi:hypothetical protein
VVVGSARVDPDGPDAVLAEQPVDGVEDPGVSGWAAGGRHDRFVLYGAAIHR